MGTNVINNLTALKFFSIATAIQKNLCLASCSSHLFLERKELLEVPLNIDRANIILIILRNKYIASYMRFSTYCLSGGYEIENKFFCADIQAVTSAAY